MMYTNNNEDERVRQLSKQSYRNKCLNLGNNEETDQRSNSENWETEKAQPVEYSTRYGRRVIGTQRWLESREQERSSKGRQMTAMNCIAEEKSPESNDNRNTEHLIMSTIIGDIMYLHQALQQPDKEEFLKAMVKEISTHQKRKHWKVVPIKEVPENIKILDLIGTG